MALGDHDHRGDLLFCDHIGVKMVGIKKLTDLERLQLITMHVAGFQEEARQYAVNLGVSKYYPTILYERFKCPYHRSRRVIKKWERAVGNGSVEV